MALGWDSIMEKLASDREVVSEFQRVYPGGLTRNSVQRALTVFTSSLITPNSPFDRWLRGSESAISEEAREGYQLFKDIGCIACHQGVNVGGNMFQALGRMDDFFAQEREPVQSDLGRYNVTGRESDKYRFKVPGLRNVALTAPYLHDGSIETLEDAVRGMAHFQLGLELEEADVESIAAFLRTLSGEIPEFAK
jgi:cytochrome c peroxidase